MRWNTDPKPNPSISPYAINQGNPIWFSDPLGDTVRVSSENQKYFMEDLETVYGELAKRHFQYVLSLQPRDPKTLDVPLSLLRLLIWLNIPRQIQINHCI